MEHIKIIIEDLEPAQRDILLARLSLAGFEGFEEGRDWLAAYMPAGNFDREGLENCLEGKAYREERIPEQNWNAAWEGAFQAVQLGKFCRVRASFHPPDPEVRYDLLITPKMSFGTGHHATTYLMLELMQELNPDGWSVLDFGTGTGLLAILAEKMGAREVMAIDHDSWSIENARENLEANHCLRCSISQASSLEGLPVYDLIAANINRQVLLFHMDALSQHLNPGGVLLLSGFLDGDSDLMKAAVFKNGMRIVKQKSKDGWQAWQVQKS